MMKKLTIMAVALTMCCATTFANDIKVLLVKTTPAVETVSNAEKLKDGLRTAAGVKKVTLDTKRNVVKIKFDADKTTKEALVSAISGLGYKVNEAVVDVAAPKTDGTSGASVQTKAKGGTEKK